MRRLKFAFSLAILAGFIFLMGTHHPFGIPLPPPGAFFNPFTGFWQNAEAGEGTPADQTLDLPGLDRPVRVVFDERKVPHIFADNNHDAFYTQGYLTARDRLWQMDISVRAAGGFLSEIMGEATLERDRLQRRKGMLDAAQRTWKAWQGSDLEREAVEAYTAGVNDYLRSLEPAQYPLEFKLLHYQPEPWTPVKSALFIKSMAESLCFRHEDLEASNTRTVLGAALFDFLYPEHNPRESPVIPEDVAWDFRPLSIPGPDTTRQMIGEVFPYPAVPQPPPYIGSNNWVVGGEKSATGYPMLCNDPHLQLTLPSVWFEVQIHTPDWNAYGVSFPGVPGIPIGFNENIAWGETNVGHDVLDWYALTWLDEGKTRYLLDDQPREVIYRTEEIRVRGRATPVVEKVKCTVWGPVVYESGNSAYRDLAMHWLAMDDIRRGTQHELGAFLQLMAGRSYEDYGSALATYSVPAQNFAFASRDGDIALKVNGAFPLKRPGQGRFVQDGSISGNNWHGFIPYEQIPQVKNPERSFVASANQRSTGKSYPYYYNGGFDDYRGRLINRILEQGQKLTIEDMMSLQNENYSIKAEEGVPLLLRLLDGEDLDDTGTRMVEDLKQWNFRFEKDSRPAVIFEEWLGEAYRLTFDEILSRGDSLPLLYPETWRFLELLEKSPDHFLFDVQETPEREDAVRIVRRAFAGVCERLAEDYQRGDLSWDHFKGTTIAHLGRVPGLGSGPLSVGGYGDAPNAIKKGHGPSWRMIVELGPELKAWGVYPGGQSGNPGSPYYSNMIDTWRKGEYYPLHFLRDPEQRRDSAWLTFTLQ